MDGNSTNEMGRRPPVITNLEWAWAILVAVATAVLLLLPYGLGHLTTPPDRVYMHLIMNPEDSLTYWAKMRQGLQGAWLYTIPFTAEPHQGALIGAFYVWLGQAARLTGASLTAVWHGARFLAGVILFLTTFLFTVVFLPDRLTRWTAYLLALTGSGLGWLLFLAGQTHWLGSFPVDFKQPGAHLFFTALTYPHIALGTALILFDVAVLKAIAVRNLLPAKPGLTEIPNPWLLAAAAGAGNVLLGLAYPFLIYIVALTAVLYMLYLIYKTRRILWAAGFQIALLFLIPAPLYLYYVWVWQHNAVFRAWEAQAGTPSPPWPHYLVAFGLMLLLAVVHGWKRPSQRAHMAVLWCWVAAVALLIYAPLGPQRRFVQGVHVALALLAAAGWVQVLLPRLQGTAVWQRLIRHPRYTSAGLSRLLVAGFLFFMALSNLLLLADVARVAGLTQPDLFFRPVEEAAAAEWLQAQPTGVVLGDYQTGNFVAAYAGQPVVLGHWAETVAYENKVTAVAQFFNAQTDDRRRQALLAAFNTRYVWFGPRERALGAFEPDTAVYLHPLYTNPSITIYQVK